MSDHDEFDRAILGLKYGQPSLTASAMFFAGIKKLAENPEAVLGMDGGAGMPSDAPTSPAAAPLMGGEFAAPTEAVVALMARVVANEFKTQLAYLVYANTLRDLSHFSIAEEFEDHAEAEIEHAKYLLRRISVLVPGGVPIPPAPSPVPQSDPQAIIQTMVAMEQTGITLWTQLREMVGETPTRFTIEQFLQQEQEHLDELMQLQVPASASAPADLSAAPPSSPGMPSGEPAPFLMPGDPMKGLPAPVKTSADLTAAARSQIDTSNFVFPKERRYPIHDRDHALAALGLSKMKGTSAEHTAVRAAVMKKYPGLVKDRDVEKKAELAARAVIMKVAAKAKRANLQIQGVDDLFAHEQEAMGAQAIEELAHTRMAMEGVKREAETNSIRAQNAEMQLQQLEQQFGQMQQQAQVAQQQAQMSAEQAAMEAQRAANTQNALARVTMRVQQFRQMLAQMAAQDPTTEMGDPNVPVAQTPDQLAGMGLQNPAVQQGTPQPGMNPASQGQMAPDQAAAAAQQPPPAGGGGDAASSGSGGDSGNPAAKKDDKSSVSVKVGKAWRV